MSVPTQSNGVWGVDTGRKTLKLVRWHAGVGDAPALSAFVTRPLTAHGCPAAGARGPERHEDKPPTQHPPRTTVSILLSRARCVLGPGTVNFLGEGLPMCGHFLHDVISCGAQRGTDGGLCGQCGVPNPPVSCLPLHGASQASQPVPLFVAMRQLMSLTKARRYLCK